MLVRGLYTLVALNDNIYNSEIINRLTYNITILM